MTQLYPIGTQLITWRLSQAALYNEVSDAKNIESFSAYEDKWIKGFKTHINDDFVSKWHVTVTKKNQNWLSPVPIVGDKVQYHDSPYCSDKITNIIKIEDADIFLVKDDPSTDIDPEEYTLHSAHITDILKRLYPNNQRASLLEWDEVILPQQGELS